MSPGPQVGLLPSLSEPPEREAVRFDGRSMTYVQLAAASAALAKSIDPGPRVAIWATRRLETCVAVFGSLIAGAPAVPLNPELGERELAHIVADSKPGLVLAAADEKLPKGLAAIKRRSVSVETAPMSHLPPEPPPESPALVLYTSGTTGPPKGVVIARRAIASNLDALYGVWEWSSADVLVHALPLFHVHGLVLGLIGPVRLGGELRYVRRFSPESVAEELRDGGTMLFGVPTMYHRLADAVERDASIAKAIAHTRLLVSGSAALPVREYRRIEAATGKRVLERYGLTETLMNCAARVSSAPTPGCVGPPLPGIDVRLVDDHGREVDGADGETVGEVVVRGPNVMLEYLNSPEATAKAIRQGWFSTGDLAVRGRDGIRIIGRKSTDLIKTGGFRVGAGEVEACLLEHPGVAEAAVTSEPDDDLGERIIAWIVPAGKPPGEHELIDHVARRLAPHKRPRVVHVVNEMPRNDLGKIVKAALGRD